LVTVPSDGAIYTANFLQENATIALSTPALNFSDPANGTSVPNQTFVISNSTPNCGTLNYALSTTVPWLSLSNAPVANDSATITVSVSDAALYAGAAYEGEIDVINQNDSSNSVSLPVKLIIANAQIQAASINGQAWVGYDCNGSGGWSSNALVYPSNPPPSDSASESITEACDNNSGEASAFLLYQYTTNSFDASGYADTTPKVYGLLMDGSSQATIGVQATHLTRFEISGTVSGSGAGGVQLATGISNYHSPYDGSQTISEVGTWSPKEGSFGVDIDADANFGVGGSGHAAFQINLQLLGAPGP